MALGPDYFHLALEGHTTTAATSYIRSWYFQSSFDLVAGPIGSCCQAEKAIDRQILDHSTGERTIARSPQGNCVSHFRTPPAVSFTHTKVLERLPTLEVRIRNRGRARASIVELSQSFELLAVLLRIENSRDFTLLPKTS